jgi:hypothetical protein
MTTPYGQALTRDYNALDHIARDHTTTHDTLGIPTHTSLIADQASPLGRHPHHTKLIREIRNHR